MEKTLDEMATSALMASTKLVATAYEWRPMETAPKDGTEIIAFFDCREVQDNGIVDIVYWDETGGPGKDGCWHLGCESDCSRAPGFYTHWMPLPDAPAKA